MIGNFSLKLSVIDTQQTAMRQKVKELGVFSLSTLTLNAFVNSCVLKLSNFYQIFNNIDVE